MTDPPPESKKTSGVTSQSKTRADENEKKFDVLLFSLFSNQNAVLFFFCIFPAQIVQLAGQPFLFQASEAENS